MSSINLDTALTFFTDTLSLILSQATRIVYTNPYTLHTCNGYSYLNVFFSILSNENINMFNLYKPPFRKVSGVCVLNNT